MLKMIQYTDDGLKKLLDAVNDLCDEDVDSQAKATTNGQYVFVISWENEEKTWNIGIGRYGSKYFTNEEYSRITAGSGIKTDDLGWIVEIMIDDSHTNISAIDWLSNRLYIARNQYNYHLWTRDLLVEYGEFYIEGMTRFLYQTNF